MTYSRTQFKATSDRRTTRCENALNTKFTRKKRPHESIKQRGKKYAYQKIAQMYEPLPTGLSNHTINFFRDKDYLQYYDPEGSFTPKKLISGHEVLLVEVHDNTGGPAPILKLRISRSQIDHFIDSDKVSSINIDGQHINLLSAEFTENDDYWSQRVESAPFSSGRFTDGQDYTCVINIL